MVGPNQRIGGVFDLEIIGKPDTRAPVQQMLRVCELRLQARSFALRQPKEQFVLIQVAYYKRWSAPLDDGRLDAFFLDVFAKCIYLVVIEANEQAAVTRPILRPRFSLIQDQLEPKQAHFKYKCPALFLMVPLQ
jgi:hypothetical protein